jgi:PRELI-like family
LIVNLKNVFSPEFDSVQSKNLILLLQIYFLHYSHPWETVAQAAWRKYPNPMNTAVIGTDVVERSVVDGVLHTHRLVSSRWYFPSWARKVSNYTSV